MDGLSQMMPGGAPPGMVPPGQSAPAGASPASGPPGAGGQPPPKAGGGGGNLLMILLSFLAGAGLGDVVKNLSKVMSPQGAGGARQHRGGVRMDAAQAPGMTIAPQMMQQMAQQGGQGGGPQGDPKLMMLIQKLIGGGAGA